MKKSQLVKLWEQVPPDYYQKVTLQRWWHNHKFETFKKLVDTKHFRKILDLGCASGAMTNKLSQIFPDAQITGVDTYNAAISYGREQYPHIKFLIADAHKLPFRNNSFDLVVCYETIEHLVNPEIALKEINRVIKKTGMAVVAMDSGSLLFRIVWWFWEKTLGKAWQGAHLHPFHHSELEDLIINSKFKIVRKHFSHFGMEVSFVLQK